jgi:thiol-disulfide isomerase/thioredoxin
MSPALVLAALVALVALTTIAGLVWQRRQGRVRRLSGLAVVTARDIPGLRRLAPGATLIQFSTTVCAPCRSTHAVLDSLATELVGVEHLDLDITTRPDLASRFTVLQTPTTLILDRAGVVRARIGGAVRRDIVRDELTRVLAS